MHFPTDYCCGAAAGVGSRRGAALARLAHLLPLVKLIRRQDGFHLRSRVSADGLHLGAAIFRRQGGVRAQVFHLLVARVEDGFDLGLGGVVQLECRGELVQVRDRPSCRGRAVAPAGEPRAECWNGGVSA